MAEWLVPEVTTGKKVGRLSAAGKGGKVSLGPFCPNTVEARERSTRPTNTLLFHLLKMMHTKG